MRKCWGKCPDKWDTVSWKFHVPEVWKDNNGKFDYLKKGNDELNLKEKIRRIKIKTQNQGRPNSKRKISIIS